MSRLEALRLPVKKTRKEARALGRVLLARVALREVSQVSRQRLLMQKADVVAGWCWVAGGPVGRGCGNTPDRRDKGTVAETACSGKRFLQGRARSRAVKGRLRRKEGTRRSRAMTGRSGAANRARGGVRGGAPLTLSFTLFTPFTVNHHTPEKGCEPINKLRCD